MGVNEQMNLKAYRSWGSSGSVQKPREGTARAPGKVTDGLDIEEPEALGTELSVTPCSASSCVTGTLCYTCPSIFSMQKTESWHENYILHLASDDSI